MGELSSQKQQREQLVRALRAAGKSWVDVAEALRQRYRFNPRVALRYAHEWSQHQAAHEWNLRWPDELKTVKSFSSWEQWPSRSGHAPTFDNLARLAELYECSVTDLLADLPNFRHQDSAAGPPETALGLRAPDTALIVPSDVAVWATANGLQLPDTFIVMLVQYLGSLVAPDRRTPITPRERDQAYYQLVQFLRRWAHTMDRRDVLRFLAWAASAASAFGATAGDEYERLASVLRAAGRVDAKVIEHIEGILWHCRKQDHLLGPQAVLTTVLAQRDLARVLAGDCPPDLRPRMLSALSEASRLAGWLSFDLKQFDHAAYYYEDARTQAYEAQNAELGALVLCEMSGLATWQRMPQVGIDHAMVAERWAGRTGDVRLQAYTLDVAGRAYAANGQEDACLRALDAAHTALGAADDGAPSCTTYDEAIHISNRGECHLKLGDTNPAVSYAQQSLGLLDSSRARSIAMTIIDLSEAYVQCKQIDEAARLLGDAGDIAAGHSSVRLTWRLEQARTSMQPWHNTKAVRTLNEHLVTYGLG